MVKKVQSYCRVVVSEEHEEDGKDMLLGSSFLDLRADSKNVLSESLSDIDELVILKVLEAGDNHLNDFLNS